MTGMRAAGIATLAVMLCAAMAPAAAQPDPADRLKRVERERKANEKRHSVLERRADNVAAEIQKLKVKMVQIANETQGQEESVSRLEAKITDLDARIAKSSASLRERREQMTAMLAALERLSRHPPVALAARPGTPVDTVRSAILMRSAIPALETRSKALSRDLAELSKLRETVALRRTELEGAGKALQGKRTELARLIDKKSQLERRAREQSSAAKARATSLAAQAEDLKDLLARLEAERLAALERKRREEARRKAELARARREAERAAAEERERAQREAERQAAERQRAEREEAERQKAEREKAERQAAESSMVALATPDAGAKDTSDADNGSPSRLLALPARGKLVRAFGQRTGLGVAAKGLSIETRPSAQVTASRAGDVVFAGPFRGYGLLVIIRHDDGHHTLLSGMARVHAAVGDRVLAGEPVGLMGSNTETKPTLYLELRRKGQPVNPLPWLTASRSKVSG